MCDKHGHRAYVYLLAANTGHDPMVMLRTWTLKQLNAVWDAVRFQQQFRMHIVNSLLEQLLSGVTKGVDK